VATAVSGGVQVASETISHTVAADADRTAKGIAKQLSSLFTQQGWISCLQALGGSPPKSGGVMKEDRT
jgi:hypothetical protein